MSLPASLNWTVENALSVLPRVFYSPFWKRSPPCLYLRGQPLHLSCLWCWRNSWTSTDQAATLSCWAAEKKMREADWPAACGGSDPVNLIILLSQNRLESEFYFGLSSEHQELFKNGLDDIVIVSSFSKNHVIFEQSVTGSSLTGLCPLVSFNWSLPYFMQETRKLIA